jgi:type IV pilus assembly protein PilN
MIRINLLPFRAARKKENVRRQISVFLLSFAFIIIAVVYWNIWLGNRIEKLTARNQDTIAQIAKYDKINKEIAKIKKTLSNLEQKIKVIETLEGGRKDAVVLMESMTEMIVKERMWFTNLSVQGSSIAIRGIALDERTIADFMKNLEGKDGARPYTNVRLKSIQQQQVKGKSLNLKNFNITLTKAAPKKTEKKGKAGKTKKS